MSVHESTAAGAAGVVAVFRKLSTVSTRDVALWRNLSQRECVGAPVTSACRLICTVQEYMQIRTKRLRKRERERGKKSQ